MDRWMDILMNGWIVILGDGDKRINILVDGEMDGWMERWRNGWMDGEMEKWMGG